MTCPHGNTLTCLKCWDEEESDWEQAARDNDETSVHIHFGKIAPERWSMLAHTGAHPDSHLTQQPSRVHNCLRCERAVLGAGLAENPGEQETYVQHKHRLRAERLRASANERVLLDEEADKIRARQESPHYTYRRKEHMRGQSVIGVWVDEVDCVDPHND